MSIPPVRGAPAVPVSIGRLRRPTSAAGRAEDTVSGDDPDVEGTTVVGGGARLIDRHGRVHRDLRISVTDRCNLRCVYCMPESGLSFLPRDELLSFSEIARVARVARRCGIHTVRITGGEPLVRPHLDALVADLSAIGFDDISLTTNGMALARAADRLARAGLSRVNISCDSLRPHRFARIRRFGRLDAVLGGMAAAERAGLHPIKVNVVLMAGWNDDEICDFAAFGRATGRTVRFIEFMPLDADRSWTRSQVVPGQRVLDEISRRWPIEAVADTDRPTGAPAERFRYTDGGGELGIIRSVTAPFCATCDRLRLTADGSLRNCLFSDDEVPLRGLLRGGGTDADLADALYRSVDGKRTGHGIDDPSFVAPDRSMSMIGG